VYYCLFLQEQNLNPIMPEEIDTTAASKPRRTQSGSFSPEAIIPDEHADLKMPMAFPP
jgi:hypothetical protein